MTVVETPQTKREGTLWRIRYDNESELDLFFARHLRSIGIGIYLIPLFDKPAWQISIESEALHNLIDSTTKRLEYQVLGSAFKGEDLSSLASLENTEWDNRTRFQVLALFWKNRARNTREKINKTTSMSEKMELEALQIGCDAIAKRTLDSVGLKEIKKSEIEQLLMTMFGDTLEKYKQY